MTEHRVGNPSVRLHVAEIGFAGNQAARPAVVADANPLLDKTPHLGFMPDFVTPGQFGAENGFIQDLVLSSLLKRGNTEKIAELRPDMDVRRPLSTHEIEVSFLVRAITRRQIPITVPHWDVPDSLFTQIHSFSYPLDKNEVASRLERERLRAQVEFPGGASFSPKDNIAGVDAARRYLANLSMAIAEEKARANGSDKKVLTREIFRPLAPQPLDKDSTDEQKERFRRANDAVNDYIAETDLGGAYFSP